MDLLFKREQSAARIGRVAFKLWGKIELSEEEQALVKRYKFDEALLLFELTPNLLRNAGLIGVGAGIIAYILFDMILPVSWASFFALIAFGGAGYWWFNEKREFIFVKDLLHGRYFSCPSIIDLASKEAKLTRIVTTLRQVIETAKHWDGTERHDIPVLPPEEARKLVSSL